MKIHPKKFLPAALALLAVSHAHAQAVLYGIGDLAGGSTYSEVRDATKFGGTIYAVGGSTAVSSNPNDRAVLWTSTGGLTAITDFTANTTGGAIATAITPDGASIAGRLHNNGSNGQTQAALISSGALNAPTALGVLSGTGIAAPNSNATGISDNGAILYGSAQYTSSNGALTKLVSYTSSPGSITAVPLPSGVTNMFFPSQAAVSADGNRVVGIANNGGGLTSPGTKAFLYIQNLSEVSLDVPYLTGGTWNGGLAINAAGTLGLIAGNSTAFPNGEVFTFNETQGAISLGSPNSAYSFLGGGSLNADGSIVTAAFSVGGTAVGYIHTASGWMSLDSVGSALGANMTGWSNLNVFGMSSDSTLLWGNGTHNGSIEGFVLDISGGSLSAIPEPSTYAAFAGLGALGLAMWQRRKRAAAETQA